MILPAMNHQTADTTADDAAKDERLDQARSKLVQIYRYLQALNELRNPVTRKIEDQPWTAWLRELPEHECIRLGRLGGQLEEDFVVKVGRPELTAAPDPPSQISEWLQPGWERLDGAISI